MATVFIPDIFSAYLNGKRTAIQDNWQDLSNYNSVLKGQLDNAATMADFGENRRQTMANTLGKTARSEQDAQKAIFGGADLDQALQILAEQLRLNYPSAAAQANVTGRQLQTVLNNEGINNPQGVQQTQQTTGGQTQQGVQTQQGQPGAQMQQGQQATGQTPANAGQTVNGSGNIPGAPAVQSALPPQAAEAREKKQQQSDLAATVEQELNNSYFTDMVNEMQRLQAQEAYRQLRYSGKSAGEAMAEVQLTYR